jgi:hypothetical protein
MHTLYKYIYNAIVETSRGIDLAVIGLTGIGPIRKISVLNWYLPYWPNESFYIVLTDLIKKKLINKSN